MKLENRVAIVTGGSKGIGLGCAKVFGKHGCRVAIGSRDETLGRQAEADLRSLGVEATYIQCDVTREEDMIGLIEKTVGKYGHLDCMLNNAGWHPPALTIEEISVADFEKLVRLNLTSTFMGCKFSLPHLRKTNGCIINMSSEVANIGQTSAPSYVPTKAGQIGLTRALALDLAAEGIRVNAVCPAGVMTPLVKEWADSEYDPEAALSLVDRWHPLGRMATAEEIGEVCAFLASDEASFITGQALVPDGGASLGYGIKYGA